MNALMLAIILAQTAQPQIPQVYKPFYLPQGGIEAYCVTLKSGDTYHGYLIKDETASGKPLQIEAYFLVSRNPGGTQQIQPLVREVEGQIRGQFVPLARDKYESAVPESEREQRDVIERYLKQAELVQVETGEGDVWVQEKEATLAAKAREMAQANALPHENPLKRLVLEGASPESGLENASVSGTNGAPAFLSVWGLHIMIATVAVILVAAVIYVAFLRG